jgi:hypothetical protein
MRKVGKATLSPQATDRRANGKDAARRIRERGSVFELNSGLHISVSIAGKRRIRIKNSTFDRLAVDWSVGDIPNSYETSCNEQESGNGFKFG